MFQGWKIDGKYFRFTKKILDKYKLQNKLPSLFYQKTTFNTDIINGCSLLHKPFVPTKWMQSGHMQTVVGHFIKFRENIKYEREIVPVWDGGQIAIDWNHNSSPGVKFEENAPLLAILPGLTTGSTSKYIQQVVISAQQMGFRSVIFNPRGFDHPFVTPLPTTGVDVTEIFDLMSHVRCRYPHAPLFAIGFSMGANILTKYLGLKTQEKPLNHKGYLIKRDIDPELMAAVSISNPFDFTQLSHSLEKPLGKIYSIWFSQMIKKNLLTPDNLRVFERIPGVEINSVKKSRKITTIDETLTRRCYDIKTTKEYYKTSSSIKLLNKIRTPLFCLNAKDDPLYGCIPVELYQSNPNIIFAVTNKGGHCGWSRGIFPRKAEDSWMLELSFQYINTTLKLLSSANNKDPKNY